MEARDGYPVVVPAGINGSTRERITLTTAVDSAGQSTAKLTAHSFTCHVLAQTAENSTARPIPAPLGAAAVAAGLPARRRLRTRRGTLARTPTSRPPSAGATGW